jgi:uncharacterized protein (DUF305 family)
MKNTNSNVLYGIIGLLLGIVLTVSIASINRSNHSNRYENKMDMHKMHDGKMMQDDDMAMMMHSMTMGLEGKTGSEFDQAFLKEMIIHHQGAVDMAKMVLTSSKNPELIKLANDIITAQNGEIKMMQDWQKSWAK